MPLQSVRFPVSSFLHPLHRFATTLLVALLCVSMVLPAVPAMAADNTVVVLPFEVNASEELDYLYESLPQLLGDKLREEGVNVVNQERTLSILRENEVEFLDLDSARKVAVLAGADWAVYGSFSQVGESISMDVRMVDAYGVKPDKSFFVVKDGLINVLPAIGDLAARVDNELASREVVAEIEVRGLRVLSEEVVLFRLDTTVGDIYDPAALNADLRRVWELGYFDDVRINAEDTPDGKRVVIEVQERPRVSAISITGSDEIDEDDITEIMSSKVGDVVNPRMLSEDLNRIRGLYRREGFYNADVSYALDESAQRGQARLTINVEEGNKLYITDIVIEGASQLDPDDVDDDMMTSERGMLSWITGDGVLDEAMLDRDAAAIEAYYANRGFINVKVAKPEVEFLEDGIRVIFRVEEGQRYSVSGLAYAGDIIVPEEELNEVVTGDTIAEEGEFFDRSVMREDLDRLTQFYTNYGYAFADASLQLAPDHDNGTLAVTYVLEKKQKVFVRRVTIEGNTSTRDNVIRRELLLADGDIFSGVKLQRSAQNLNRLQYFEVAEIERVPTGDPSLMDLRVKVKEKATGSISAGGGYSSFDKVFVGGSLEDRNLFGRGLQASISAYLSGRKNQYNIRLYDPRFMDSGWGLGGTAFLQENDFIDYEQDTVGGTIFGTHALGDWTRGTITYKAEQYEIGEVDEDAAQLFRDFEGERISSVLSVSATRDTTNHPQLPTAGTKITLSVENGGGIMGGDDGFIKPLASFDYYHALPWDTSFHWRVSGGWVIENFNDDKVPPFERFFLGGISDVRGYDGNRISPLDEASGDRIGGDKQLFTNFEFFFPILDEYQVKGIAFFDAGNAWDTDEFFFESTPRGEDSQTLGLYKSVGAGLWWFSPFGLIRVEYGYPLNEVQDSSADGKFEFSVGQTF